MFNKRNKMNQRFETVYEQGTFSVCRIIVDTATGINYLFIKDGYAGGLTVLLDKDGNPVVSEVKN